MRKPNRKMLTGGTVVKTREGNLYMVLPGFTTPKESRDGRLNHEMINGKVLIGLSTFGWDRLDTYNDRLIASTSGIKCFDIVEVYQPTCQSAVGRLMEHLSFGPLNMDDLLVQHGEEKEAIGYIKVAERKDNNNER